MKSHTIKNNCVEAGVTEECGHLFPVKFFFGENIIEPMNVSPWYEEQNNGSIEPMLRTLRGDFFCAPFGACDILENESRGHGASANERWELIQQSDNCMTFRLPKEISGAKLTKEISIRENENVIYQKHTFTGGSGKIPVGHHAMLRVKTKGYLSFSDFAFGGTPSEPVESDPVKGFSVLQYPQQFADIKNIKLYDNSSADVSVYPFVSAHEDVFMIISAGENFGWSAFSCPNEGWLWFSLKNPSVLPCTMIWLSNGGRYYPPFSSRHTNVIGIEETVTYFHLGHKASIEENDLNTKGFKTYLELQPNSITEIPYLFGLVEIPKNFGKVKIISEIEEGIEITDENNNSVFAKVNMNFIKESR